MKNFVTVTEKFGKNCPKGSVWIYFTTATVFEESDDTLLPLEKEMVNIYQCLYGGYRIATVSEDTLINHPEYFKPTR